jgi:hypothetical protein
MAITAETNAPYANRIQIMCSPFVGPFMQDGPLGAFNPTRDLQIYVDGTLIPIQTWTFDVPNNRYLLYMNQAINLQGVIQITHHMPSPPFQSQTNPALFYLEPGDEPDSGSGGM